MNTATPNKDIEEVKRLQTLMSYNILDTPEEAEFDGLAELISLICEVPIAIISMIDDKRQWYKAKVGVEYNEVKREEFFCQHTLLQDKILEIPDTRLDERVKDSDFVKSEDGMLFYAGVPIKVENGYNLGTVCIADHLPRKLTEKQRKALEFLTGQVSKLLETKIKNESPGTELEILLDERVRNTQRRLLQKSVEFNELLNAIKISNGVVEFDPEGYILKTNEKFLKIFGYSNDELIGQHHTNFLPEEDRKKDRDFWLSLRQNKFKSGSMKRLHKNGSEIWIQATYNPILDADNQVIRVIKISQDITKEIRTQEKLHEAMELADQLSRQKDNFIANFSHEIRTPIHVVLGFTKLLLDLENDHQKLDYLKTVKLAGDNLLFLVNDILDLSKIESGIFQVEAIDFDLPQTIHNVFSMLKLKADQKHLKFDYIIGKDVPRRLVGDKNKLSQIIINLLGNAIKFTHKGKVRLDVKVVGKVENEIQLKFTVSDTGIGISSENLDKVFQRFSQADGDIARKFGGTGLGLNISSLLVEKQGGKIEVESRQGVGSRFIFSLPFGISSTLEKQIPDSVVGKDRESKASILVCEDNILNQNLVKAILNKQGFEVTIAPDGREGIRKFEKNHFDLILMDIQMPELDGFNTTAHIRQVIGSNVPIIALTANFLLQERGKCILAGMDDYLSKPFTMEDLLEKIDFWLKHRDRTKESPKVPNIPATELKVVDLKILEAFSGGDRDFENEMILIFLRDTSKMFEDLKSAKSSGDLDKLKATAHKMKTSFGLIGADRSILLQFENLEFSKDVTNLNRWVSNLKKQLKSVYIILNRRIDQKNEKDSVSRG